MAKRYTEREDNWIISFFDVVGAEQISTDMERSPASIKARARHLKSSGAWQAEIMSRGYKALAALKAGRLSHEIALENAYEAIHLADLDVELM